jgi:hypothetical protein
MKVGGDVGQEALMSQEQSRPPKQDEPMNPPDPSQDERGQTSEPDPDRARPPRGYDDPLRRERKSGMITPGHEEPRVPDAGTTTQGDRGGTG